ncbi:MAG TPA: hypothetical protein EYN94_04780 [Pelagibacterales bacterium]|nr:hypothetical protein [Pelagibacterales bacterium]
MQAGLNQYLVRVGVFLAVIFVVVVLLYPVLQNAFLSNVFINSVIILALVIGLIYNIYHLFNLSNEFSSLSGFNIYKSPQSFLNSKSILKNISLELKQLDGFYVFKSSSINRLIESVDMSLASVRETSRYLVGLLVFLGLLGTFWGLLKTIGSVGNVISGLGIDDTNVAGFFNSLKDGLNAPLQGMSIAFSSSLLGLAGSLILGFVDLNLGQAQSKFSQYFEKTLNKNSSPDFFKTTNNENITTQAIQKIYDNLDTLVHVLKETAQNQNQIFLNLQSLNEQLNQISKNSVEIDKKLSNFLSTQLNAQSSMLQFSNQLSKEGIIDSKTKKYFENIDKGIQKLITANKKK